MIAHSLPRNTKASLIALAAGIGAGVAVRFAGHDGLTALAAPAASIGRVWGAALQITVIPLIVCILIVGLAGSSGRIVGRLGGLSLIVFLSMLVSGEVMSILAMPPMLRLFGVEHSVLRHLMHPNAAAATPTQDIVQAIATNNLLNVMLVALVVAIAMTRIGEAPRRRLLEFFEAALDVVFVVLGWLLSVLPLVVFALSYSMVVRTGFSATRALASFVAIAITLLVVFTIALYPMTMIFAKRGLREFAKATAPVQAVAISTRSSIASLPALLEGGQRLGIPEPVNAFVMPLCVAVFKANRTITGMVKLFFLAWVCGVELTPLTIAAYGGSILLFSFISPGTPGAATFTSTAPLLAIGIPIEAIVLVHAVDDIPDIFKTVTNVTANMTATAVVARYADVEDTEAAALEPADVTAA